MTTRLESLRKYTPEVKNYIDSVFLRNKQTSEVGDENIMREPYKKSDLVYICISTTAKAIAQVPLLVYEVDSDGGKTKPLSIDDEWQQLFKKPNFITDEYSFRESIITHLLLDGDVFIVPFPPMLHPPVSLWVVKKKYMRPVRDPKTGQLSGWYYNPKGIWSGSYDLEPIQDGAIPLFVEDVCHIFLFNPYDPIMGMAPIEAGRLNVIVDYKAGVYTSVFFDEGAVPGGLLATEHKLGDIQFKRTKEQFDERHQGFRKGHRVAVLEQGLKYTQTGLTQKDMEFKILRQISAERIYQIFGMKKAIISITEDVNFATSREQRKEWWEGTNIPLMRMSTSALNLTLFRDNRRLCADFDLTKVDALKEALKEKVDTGYRLWQMGFTANEINRRLDLGFDEEDWRDTWYMPVNMIPVTDAITPPRDEPKPPKRITGIKRSLLLPGDVKEKDNPRAETIWNGLMRAFTPYEDMFEKKTSRVFFDMRKHTLDLLYKNPKTPSDVEGEIYSDEMNTIDRLTDPVYTDVLMTSVAMFIEEVGVSISFSLLDPEAIAFLMTKKLKIRGIISTISEQIRDELIQGYQNGETIEEIANRIRKVFDIAKSRAKTIARTEIVGAANEGRHIALTRSGFKEKEWFTARDERVRPQHVAMHGKIIPVEQPWVFPDGTSVRHPGDYNGPASQIVNCRCIEIIVPGTHYLS